MGKSTISMAIFDSYVNLPEGNREWTHHLEPCENEMLSMAGMGIASLSNNFLQRMHSCCDGNFDSMVKYAHAFSRIDQINARTNMAVHLIGHSK